MSKITRRLMLLGSAVLVAGLIAGGLPSPEAHAALVACGTDPIVTLSNGAQVAMSNTIYDYSTNVTQVSYSLHGPSGTTVNSVSYANSTWGIPETFTYHADNQPGNYDS